MPDKDPIAPHGGALVNLLAAEGEVEALVREAEHLPKITVSERELSDLEMLTVGALSPLTGFQREADYDSVLETMHLPSGLPWTIPVTLSLTEEEVKRIGARRSFMMRKSCRRSRCTRARSPTSS